jgi:hypothetical protein
MIIRYKPLIIQFGQLIESQVDPLYACLQSFSNLFFAKMANYFLLQMPYNDCQQQQQLRDVGLGRKAN